MPQNNLTTEVMSYQVHKPTEYCAKMANEQIKCSILKCSTLHISVSRG